jgi:probable HAF family extracellular repeat protein
MTSTMASLTVSVLLMAPLSAVAQQYIATDIDTLGGSGSVGTGISASGQVTGYTYTKAGPVHAFLYSNGTMQDLGTLGGAESRAFGINSSGQVTGGADLAGDATSHAFIYSAGSMKDLGAFGEGGSGGNGINASGQVTGSWAGPNGDHAFLYSDGTMHDLGTLPTQNGVDLTSIGFAINATGQVTGSSEVPESNATSHAFLYSNGSMQDLGTLGPSGTELNSQGNGINASGQVTGFAEIAPDARHAFLYSNGTMQDLGTLPSSGNYGATEGNAINASGQIVGEAYSYAGQAPQLPFLYTNGQMFDLNSLLSPSQASIYKLSVATAINDSGQIVVNGYNSLTSHNTAFLLTPSMAPAPVVTLGTGSLNFSNQLVNSSSAAQSVALTNTGTGALGLSTITVIGLAADDYILTHTCGTSLAVNATCTVSVIFKPVSVGAKKATISIRDNAIGSPQSVTLLGTGVLAPTLKLSATGLTFASQSVGITSGAQTVTLTNAGTAALTLHSFTLKGGQADDYILTKTCGVSLAANASCVLSVTFKPVSVGVKMANISISDTATGSPQSVALSGTAVAAPTLKLSTTVLTFASESVGMTSAAQTVTLTNGSNAVLQLHSFTLKGGQADDYTLTKSCGASLAANASCVLAVTFKPVSVGAKKATISISDNAAGSPQSVALSGTGA